MAVSAVVLKMNLTKFEQPLSETAQIALGENEFFAEWKPSFSNYLLKVS